MPASVTESDIANVKVGDAVAVLFAALTDADDPNGTTVQGTISEVDLTSTVSSSVVSYGVTISLTSPPADLRLGQSATATITTSSKQNVLRVASNAITTVGTAQDRDRGHRQDHPDRVGDDRRDRQRRDRDRLRAQGGRRGGDPVDDGHDEHAST